MISVLFASDYLHFMVEVENMNRKQGTVVHTDAKQSEPPGPEVKIDKEGDTSGVRGIELPPHVRDFRILRNGKLIYTDIDPDRPRTTASLRTVGEENTSNPICEDFPESQSIPVSSQVENSSRPKIPTIDSFPYRPCEVILSDIFASDETEKLKLLNCNQDKTHSVHSQPLEDKGFFRVFHKSFLLHGQNQVIAKLGKSWIVPSTAAFYLLVFL